MNFDDPALKISPRFSRGKPPNDFPVFPQGTTHSSNALVRSSYPQDKFLTDCMCYRSCTFGIKHADISLSAVEYNLRSTRNGAAVDLHDSTSNLALTSFLEDKFSYSFRHCSSSTKQTQYTYISLSVSEYYPSRAQADQVRLHTDYSIENDEYKVKDYSTLRSNHLTTTRNHLYCSTQIQVTHTNYKQVKLVFIVKLAALCVLHISHIYIIQSVTLYTRLIIMYSVSAFTADTVWESNQPTAYYIM